MKLKTIIELLTLSTSLYSISKDEKLMNELGTFASKGKNGLDKLIHDFSENEYGEFEESETQKTIHKILLKASEAKEELYVKIEEVAAQMYEKMNIAQANDLKKLTEEIELLKLKLQNTEAKVIELEKFHSNK